VSLDLGSGGGKICFIAAQVVGPAGAVIGVDMNEEMLVLACGAAPEVSSQLGYSNTRLLRARIQALPLDRRERQAPRDGREQPGEDAPLKTPGEK